MMTSPKDRFRGCQTRRSREEGFTLIELLVTVAVLAVGLLALAQMGVMAIQTNKSTSEYAIATRLAANKIDRLKKSPYAELAPNTYTDPNNLLNPDETSGGTFSRSWIIANGLTSGTKRITVTVSWADGTKKVALNSLVADPG
jgi:prepilin-type N-terminal cleavage/methylation domain-containing protein